MTSASLFFKLQKEDSKAQDLGRCPAVSGIFLCLSCKSGADSWKTQQTASLPCTTDIRLW